MSKNGEALQPHIEQHDIPKYNEDVVHFQDNVSTFRITGERGAIFKINEHQYRPTRPLGYAIVYTTSGDYLVFTRDQTVIVEFSERGVNEVARMTSQGNLSPVEFGKPWKPLGSYQTPGIVESVLLLYKAYADHSVGIKMDGPSPFDSYVRRLNKPMRWCQLSDPNSSPHYMP